MNWILIFIIFFIIAIIIFFKMPYSKTKTSFQNAVNTYTKMFNKKSNIITEKGIEHLPELVQNYFRICGYIGKTKMTSMKASMSNVPLVTSKDKSPMIVDYTLCSFADEPVRLAYIKTSIFGIPFEVYDSVQSGTGFMKGIIGKEITLFNQVGEEMDKGQLLTYLGECFLIPSSILNEYITWKPIDDTHVEATITFKNISGSGIFTFDKNGFVDCFQTDERVNMGTDGSIQYTKWSAVYEDYAENEGVYLPTRLKAIWHYSDGDLVYFDAKDFKFGYDNPFDITK